MFGTLFCKVLKLFECFLGVFLSFSCSFWEPPRLEKYGFCIGKQQFSRMCVFGTLKLLMSFLFPSSRFLSLYNPKMAPEINPKRDPTSEKNDLKICQLFNPIFTKFRATTFGVHFGPKKSVAKKNWDPKNVFF